MTYAAKCPMRECANTKTIMPIGLDPATRKSIPEQVGGAAV